MKIIKNIKNVALLSFLLSASVANATVYHFDMTGTYTANWDLDSTVVPDFVNPTTAFRLENVAGYFPNSENNLVKLVFWNSKNAGGLNILDQQNSNGLSLNDGPQLYTGTEAVPTFKLGSFVLSNAGALSTLVITEETALPPAGVPEPVSLGLMGIGLLSLAGALRRRA